MKRILLSLFGMLFLAGCVTTLPGNVNTQISSFDGVQTVRLEPGFVSEDGPMSPGKFKRAYCGMIKLPRKYILYQLLIAF